MKKKLNLVVLMGGMSSEHEVSLNTGENIIKFLDKRKYNIKPIVINKKGDWLVVGRKKTVDETLKGVDVVFNALHGEYGEDGGIQGLLDCFNVPYTGSGILASALGMDKVRSRELFKIYGLIVPKYVVIKEKLKCLKLSFEHFGRKLVVKPSRLGSSIGISVINNTNKGDLKKAINKAFKKCDEVIIEEYINGREMTCGIIENTRRQEHYALPVTEIIPPNGKFFDYDVKYDGSTQEITPARIDKNLAKKIQEQAIKAHQILGCRGYSRADFIIAQNATCLPARLPDGQARQERKTQNIYILEVNTLPGLTKESLLPKAAKEIGVGFPELLDIIINNALN